MLSTCSNPSQRTEQKQILLPSLSQLYCTKMVWKFKSNFWCGYGKTNVVQFHTHILKEIYKTATTANQIMLETMKDNISVTKMPHTTGSDNWSCHHHKNVHTASAFSTWWHIWCKHNNQFQTNNLLLHGCRYLKSAGNECVKVLSSNIN
jgi:hypothetical protein